MKRLYSAITILCIAISAQLSHAQTVKGKVFDNENRTFSGVVVKDKVSGVGASTDMDGNYALTLIPGSHTIEFILIGFVTQTKEIKLVGRSIRIGCQA